MATFVIGDVHGCYQELKALLKKINFCATEDKVYFTGDLINRGPDSNSVIDLVRAHEGVMFSVLGNHDISLLAYEAGIYKKDKIQFDEILSRRNAAKVVEWLNGLPLLIDLDEHDTTIVHAGLPPLKVLSECREMARKAEQVISGDCRDVFLKHAYKKGGSMWREGMSDKNIFRYTLNSMTRMRFCKDNGTLDFKEKCEPSTGMFGGLRPWYELRAEVFTEKRNVVFGHWAAMGCEKFMHFQCLDSGCAWGGKLTALKLDDGKLMSVDKIG